MPKTTSQIENVQRRAARFVTNRYHNASSVSDMLHTLNWSPLYLRTRACLIMFYKIIHHTVAIYSENNLLIPTDSRTKNSKTYTATDILEHPKTATKYSFYPRTVGQWNMLPLVAHQAATVDFQSFVTVPLLLSAISN